jgi:hypothetical protein
MKAIEALRKLSRLGYRFELAGDRLRYHYHGPGKPDPDMVKPLLEAVKEHKPDVMAYLSKPAPTERILTCADCNFHEYQGPNPAHGWGCCTFKEKGCYGLRPACEDVLLEMHPDVERKH